MPARSAPIAAVTEHDIKATRAARRVSPCLKAFDTRKELNMKRLATAVLLASLAVPALALEIAPPYSQLNIDRQLPDVKDPVIEQASSGATRSRSEQVAAPASAIGFTEATGPWANDWNFIAPAP
jgi:hypothetical protein